MNKKVLIAITIISCLSVSYLLALTLGPYVLDHFEFFKGLVFGMAGIMCFVLLFNLFSKGASKNTSVLNISLILLSIVLGVLSFIQLKSNKQNLNLEHKNNTIEESKILASRNDALMGSVDQLMIKIDQEIKSNSGRELSKETINEISLLTEQLKPYKQIRNGKLDTFLSSPGRGLVLKLLLNKNISKNAFEQIKKQVSFAHSDLENFEIKDKDLSNIDLSGSYLKDCIFETVRLNNSKLTKAIFWGSSLKDVSLKNSNLDFANFSWSMMKGITLSNSTCGSTNFSNSNLSYANLDSCYLQCAILESTNLSNSSAVDSDFIRSNITKVNFKNANLTRGDIRISYGSNAIFKNANLTNGKLRGTSLKGADLRGTNLNGVYLYHGNWLEKIEQWKVLGRKAIASKYVVEKDSTQERNFILKAINTIDSTKGVN